MRCATMTGLAVFAVFVFALAFEGLAVHDYPRVSNCYWGSVTQADCELLSRWDFLCLSASIQDANPTIIDSLRARNPDIIILAYFPAGILWPEYESMAPTQAAYGHKVAECDWWLRDTKDNPIGCITYDCFTNFSTKCPPDTSGLHISEWLADHIATQIIPTGLWDGIFIDGLLENPYTINNWQEYFVDPPAMVDLDQDGQADHPDSCLAWWGPGIESFLARLRQHIGDSYIMVGNGKNYWSAYLNGGVREAFPFMHGGWYENMFSGYGYMTQCEQWCAAPMKCPHILSIWRDEQNTVHAPNRTSSYERFLRWTLTSALLGDGYYALHGGVACLWWEDYYDLYLGAPTTDAYLDSIWNDVYSCFRPLWKRQFENATVMCNPGPDWVILEDGTWLAPEDGRIETYSIPDGMGIGITREQSGRTFDQKDTAFGYDAAITNASESSAFVYVRATLSRGGETRASSSPRRFLIGAGKSETKSLWIRIPPTLTMGTYVLEVFVEGPDHVPVDSDTLFVERIISLQTEAIEHTDTGGQPSLSVYPEPVVSTQCIAMAVTGNPTGKEIETSVSLYDVRGRLVGKVFDGRLGPDQTVRIRLQGPPDCTLSPGVYILHAETESMDLTKKIIIVR